MAEKLVKKFDGFLERGIHMSIVLNKKTSKKNVTEYPVAARFTEGTTSFYVAVGGSYSEKEFSEICTVGKSGSDLYKVQMKWQADIEMYKELLQGLNVNGKLTLDMVRTAITGKVSDNANSFLKVWEDVIKHLQEDNNGEQYRTGDNYKDALNKFKKIMWDVPINGFQIGKDEIQLWKDRMIHGYHDKDGKPLKAISSTTIGIYLRACRVAWNECISRGFIPKENYPFSNIKKKDLVNIPKGKTRKESYLTIPQWKQLYEVFKSKSYPEEWRQDHKDGAHIALGLFLAQYLCNGFNLMDAALLEYTQFYFDKNKEAFWFIRHKTGNTANDGEGEEVVFPVIEPLQYILNEIAAPVKKGEKVFPWILNDLDINKKEDKGKIIDRMRDQNKSIRKKVRRICKEVLGWDVEPSNTFCRHSFATNLTHVGVERQYISEAMGHAHDQSITDRYIAQYSIEMQKEINNKLLGLDKTSQMMTKDIKKMTKAELQALLLELTKDK